MMRKFIFIVLIIINAGSVAAQDPIPTVDLSLMKYGLKDSLTNDVILPAKYDYITSFYEGYAIARNDRNYGLIDKKGQEILSLNYQEFKRVSSTCFRVKQAEKYGLLNSDASIALPLVFNDLHIINESALVHNGQYWGVIDLSGNIQLPFVYDSILTERTNHGQAYLDVNFIKVIENRIMGAVNIQNEPVFPFELKAQEINQWNDSIIWVKNEKGEEGILSIGLDTILSFGYFESIMPISNGLFGVENQGKYGFMDLNFDTVITMQFDKALSFQNGRATVQRNGYWGMIDQEGGTLISFLSKDPIIFQNGLAVLRTERGNGYTLINEKGDILNRLRFDEVIMSPELVLTKLDGFWGALNKDGIMVIPFEYDEMMVKRSYIVVVKDHLQGLFSAKGERILKAEYEFIYPTFDDPYIMVRKLGKYGYVNHDGKTVIPIRYENARNFRFGRATVLLNDESYEINRSGDNFGIKNTE